MVLRPNLTKGINTCKEENGSLRRERGSAEKPPKAEVTPGSQKQQPPLLWTTGKGGSWAQIQLFWSQWQDHPYWNISSALSQTLWFRCRRRPPPPPPLHTPWSAELYQAGGGESCQHVTAGCVGHVTAISKQIKEDGRSGFIVESS